MLKRKFKWNDQTNAIAAKMWAEGESMGDIAEALGVERGTVSGHMNRHRDDYPKRGGQGKPARINIAPRKGGQRVDWTDEMYATARKLWSEFKTAAQIAEAIGATAGAVSSKTCDRRDIFPHRDKSALMAACAAENGVSKTISQSNARRRAAKENQERIACGLPPISHHKLITDFSVFAIPGITPSTLFLVKDKQCKWPISSNDDPTGADMPVCGANRTDGSYCSHHARIARPLRA